MNLELFPFIFSVSKKIKTFLFLLFFSLISFRKVVEKY